jgi:hypothetical protein
MGVGLDGASPAWQVVAASTVGTRHAAAQQVCDDANAHWQDGSGLVLVAADGAGSASRAAEGARLAAEVAQAAAVRLLGAGPPDRDAAGTGLQAVLLAARQALDDLAAGDGDPSAGQATVAELATTLTVVLAWPELLGVAQVGDGAVVVRRDGAKLELLLGPEPREYVNETTFLTSPAFLDSAQIVVAEATEVTGIAVMTDGLQLLALDLAARTPHSPFFEPLFAFAGGNGDLDGELGAFLGSESVCARTDDDKTLLLAVRRTG